jgi:UDP-N-acetylmuramate--alanine ligase
VPDGTHPGGAAAIDLSRPQRIHLIGIGGAGLSAMAIVLLQMGHRVTGSDRVDSEVMKRLAALGADVHVGHDAAHLGPVDVVAVSTAIPPGNPEVAGATARGLTVWRRSDLLAAICRQRRTIAVAGTHGKTSTSSMLAVILRGAGLQPSYVIGGDLAGFGPGAAWEPAGGWMVVEADESDGTFLDLGAEAVVVTSVEPDHLDYYGDEKALRRAFRRFVDQAPGARVLCADDAGAADLAAASDGGPLPRVHTYGTAPGADVHIEDVSLGATGSRFSISHAGKQQGPFGVDAPGLLYVRNATAALTMAHAIGVDWEAAGRALEDYHGVGRRFERRGQRQGVVFVFRPRWPAPWRRRATSAASGSWPCSSPTGTRAPRPCGPTSPTPSSTPTSCS